jgi:hypothetical protein
MTMMRTLAQAPPELDDVLRSVQGSVGATADITRIIALLVAGLVCVLVFVFIRKMNQRQTAPRVVNSPKKLARELSQATGIDASTFENLGALARSQGMASPLVAMICPTALRTLAKAASTPEERKAVLELARKLSTKGTAPEPARLRTEGP